MSYCDPGAQGSQVDVSKAKQPGVVLTRVTGVAVRVVTFSARVVLITAGVSVVWPSTVPATTTAAAVQQGLNTELQKELKFIQTSTFSNPICL